MWYRHFRWMKIPHLTPFYWFQLFSTLSSAQSITSNSCTLYDYKVYCKDCGLKMTREVALAVHDNDAGPSSSSWWAGLSSLFILHAVCGIFILPVVCDIYYLCVVSVTSLWCVRYFCDLCMVCVCEVSVTSAWCVCDFCYLYMVCVCVWFLLLLLSLLLFAFIAPVVCDMISVIAIITTIAFVALIVGMNSAFFFQHL